MPFFQIMWHHLVFISLIQAHQTKFLKSLQIWFLQWQQFKSLGCVRDPYNDHGFDGNTVQQILNNLSLLYETVPPEYLDLVLEKIKVKHVYIKCFSAMSLSQQIQSLKLELKEKNTPLSPIYNRKKFSKMSLTNVYLGS